MRKAQWSSAKRIEEKNTVVQCKENRKEKHSGPVQRELKRETQWSKAKRIEERETQRSNALRIGK